MINAHVLANAKAYAALVGAVATALLGVYAADTAVGQWLTVAAAVSTAIGTWAVPNLPGRNPGDVAARDTTWQY